MKCFPGYPIALDNALAVLFTVYIQNVRMEYYIPYSIVVLRIMYVRTSYVDKMEWKQSSTVRNARYNRGLNRIFKICRRRRNTT